MLLVVLIGVLAAAPLGVGYDFAPNRNKTQTGSLTIFFAPQHVYSYRTTNTNTNTFISGKTHIQLVHTLAHLSRCNTSNMLKNE